MSRPGTRESGRFAGIGEKIAELERAVAQRRRRRNRRRALAAAALTLTAVVAAA